MVLRHNCGLAVAHTLHDVYSFIKSLQHRGREAAGIAAISNDKIDVVKWSGPVNTFDIVDLHKILPGHNYHTYMAHVRYATRGRKDKILEDAHPHTIGGEVIDKGNHVLVLGCQMAAVHNGQINDEYLSCIDKGLLKTECDTEAFLHLYRNKGEHEILKTVPAAYTIAIADIRKQGVVVLRDRTGIKPGCLGWKDGKYCVASEDIALRKNGAEFIEDIDPGSIYTFTSDGNIMQPEQVVEPKPRYCFFEWAYLADKDSVLNGVLVRAVREMLGEACACEFPEDIDAISYLPRCPETAAQAFKKVRKIPFVHVFYKMRGERSFQGSTLEERTRSIESNLHLLPGVRQIIKGMRLGNMDDSTVRGNNSKRARYLAYEEGGVAKCHHINYTPPIGIMGEDGEPRGCMFGVDMAPDDEFIARDKKSRRNRTLEEISNELGMPVWYISREGHLRAFEAAGIKRENLCTYCIGGSSPLC
jgi:amidophosphoribosyltransferase